MTLALTIATLVLGLVVFIDSRRQGRRLHTIESQLAEHRREQETP